MLMSGIALAIITFISESLVAKLQHPFRRTEVEAMFQKRRTISEEHQSQSSTETMVEIRAAAEQTDNPVQDELQEKTNNTIEVNVQVENLNSLQNDTNHEPLPGP